MAASKKKRATEEAMDDVSHSNTDDNTGQDGEELADCGEVRWCCCRKISVSICCSDVR